MKHKAPRGMDQPDLCSTTVRSSFSFSHSPLEKRPPTHSIIILHHIIHVHGNLLFLERAEELQLPLLIHGETCDEGTGLAEMWNDRRDERQCCKTAIE